MSKQKNADIFARVVSIAAILSTVTLAIVTWRIQYGENLFIEFVQTKDDYIHALSLHQTRGLKASISRIAVWKELILSNRSNVAISVVSTTLKEGNAYYNEMLGPFFGNVSYLNNSTLCTSPVELPFYLGPGESKKLFLLLPIHVPEQIGEILFEIMMKGKPIRGTVVSATLFSPTFFVELSGDRSDLIQKIYSGSAATIDMISIDSIDLTRSLVTRSTDGYHFLEEDNNAPDGLRYYKGIALFAEMLAERSPEKTLTLDAFALDYKSYQVFFQTGSGRSHEAILISKDLPFSKYPNEVMQKLQP
jgi:hypothetical protein